MRISYISPTSVELTLPNVVILFSYNNPVALRVKDSDVVLRISPGRRWISTHINRWIREMDCYSEEGEELRKYSTLVKYIRVVGPEFFDDLFNYNGLDCVVHRQIGISLNEYRKKLKGDRDLLRHSSNAPTNSLPDSVHNQGVPVPGPSNPERERQRFVTDGLVEHIPTMSVPRAGSTGQTTQAEETHWSEDELREMARQIEDNDRF